MRASADRDEPRIGLLTPGTFSETYFEHATLARYLGFLLVEGDDLAVSGDRIHIRTVAGLKRLDVLLRRVDSNSLDPLELDASSQLGVPGLIDVVRKNGVVVANMPGSGVMEARALLGFLPSLSQRFFGEDLKMPHIATWWCGQKAAREEVLSRLDEFAIEGAYGRGVPGFGRGPILAGELSPSERERLKTAIRDRGIDYVGQELVRLSTTPVWDNGRITPRPFVLRVFAAATPDGWTIMPGGFCRIADQPDARAVSMGDGARAADVWVVSDKAVSTAIAAAGGRHRADQAHRRRGAEPRRRQSVLARPLSRARRGDAAAGAGARHAARSRQGLADRAALGRADPAAAGDVGRDLAGLAGAAVARSRPRPCRARKNSARRCRWCARRSAPRHRCANGCRRMPGRSSPKWPSGSAHEVEDDDGVVSAAELTLQELASFAGLAQENMNRAAGWRFLEMGRRAERAINTVRFARQFAYDEAGGEDLDILLTLVDCQITYRSRYLVGPLLAPVRDLVVLDPYNPRSVAFQVSALNDHIASLPTLKEGGLIERPHRLAVALQAMLTTAEAASLDTKTLFALEQDLLTLADAIGSHYFPHGPNASRPEKLTGLA